MTAYQMIAVDGHGLPAFEPLLLDDLLILVFYGTFVYADASNFTLRLRSDGVVQVGQRPVVKPSHKAVWLLLFSRYREDVPGEKEHEIKHRISAAIGLLQAILGRNVAHEKFCENLVDIHRNVFSATSSIWRNPYVFGKPEVTEDGYELVTNATRAVGSRPRDRNRIRLALHWYQAGADDDGVDAYLKLWIALEVLAMPDGTNIGPLRRLLSDVYAIPLEDVNTRLHLGLLYRLRSQIVHQGTVTTLHDSINQYLDAVFRDALHAVLGLPHRGYALVRAEGKAFLKDLLQGLVRTT